LTISLTSRKLGFTRIILSYNHIASSLLGPQQQTWWQFSLKSVEFIELPAELGAGSFLRFGVHDEVNVPKAGMLQMIAQEPNKHDKFPAVTK
jgi:hypothetical protein